MPSNGSQLLNFYFALSPLPEKRRVLNKKKKKSELLRKSWLWCKLQFKSWTAPSILSTDQHTSPSLYRYLTSMRDQTSAAGRSGEQRVLSGCAVSPCVSANSSRQSTFSHRSCSAASSSDVLALCEPASPEIN